MCACACACTSSCAAALASSKLGAWGGLRSGSHLSACFSQSIYNSAPAVTMAPTRGGAVSIRSTHLSIFSSGYYSPTFILGSRGLANRSDRFTQQGVVKQRIAPTPYHNIVHTPISTIPRERTIGEIGALQICALLWPSLTVANHFISEYRSTSS